MLVNNAGIPARGSFLDIDPELVERVMAVNYLGIVWCLRAFEPGLRAASDAHVVNLVSVSGTVAFAPAGAYSASKHAQLAFSRSTAALLHGSGDPGSHRDAGIRRDRGLPAAIEAAERADAALVIEADDVAKAIVKAVEKGKSEITVPWFPYRIATIGQAVVPGLFSRLVTRQAGQHRDE